MTLFTPLAQRSLTLRNRIVVVERDPSLFLMSTEVLDAHQSELEPYRAGKGTIREENAARRRARVKGD